MAMQGGSRAIAGVRQGDVLAGKYRIETLLGAGGMGVVFAAHHLALDQRVAIKFLLPEALGSPDVVARFGREARAAVKIKSEHVVRIIDVGALDSGVPYMVMEYLEGGDLGTWVRQKGPLPIEEAVEFVIQACEAIADAHGTGIVHRDLKPANLFCIRRSDGRLAIKVLDFGISKITGSQPSGPDMGMTRTAVVMGTPYYMSPEQLRSARDVDARTDIWSVGVTLFELLCGRVPFQTGSFPDLCMEIVTRPLPSLRQLRPEVPVELEQVIAKCLEKDAAGRFQTVADLAVALAPFAPRRARALVERISGIIQSAGLAASAVAVSSSCEPTVDGSITKTVGSWGQTAPPPPGRRKKLVLAGVSASLMIAVPLLALLTMLPGSPTGGSPSTAAEGVGSAEPQPSDLVPAAALPRAETHAVAVASEIEPTRAPGLEDPPKAENPDAGVGPIEPRRSESTAERDAARTRAIGAAATRTSGSWATRQVAPEGRSSAPVDAKTRRRPRVDLGLPE